MVSRIKDGQQVTIHYRLSLEDGTVLEDSKGKAPLVYLHGSGQIVPGLERELAGKEVGYECEAQVAPADGFGEYDPAAEQTVPKSAFPAETKVEVGQVFHTNGPRGPVSVRIHRVDGDSVVITTNHALAGQRLNFHVRIVDIREATAEPSPPQDSG